MNIHAAPLTADAFRVPATLAQKAETARAEFISSTEPECSAHFAYAAEDARDISMLAVSLRSFLTGAVAKMRQLNYGRASAADLALMGECIADQIEDVLTAEAAALFRAELRAISGEG